MQLIKAVKEKEKETALREREVKPTTSQEMLQQTLRYLMQKLIGTTIAWLAQKTQGAISRTELNSTRK